MCGGSDANPLGRYCRNRRMRQMVRISKAKAGVLAEQPVGSCNAIKFSHEIALLRRK